MLLNKVSGRCETDRHTENMAKGPGFTRFWLSNQSSHAAPFNSKVGAESPGHGAGSRPGKAALGPRSDVAVTNVVLAQATPLSFVCLFESDLWFAQNWNGLQPLTHLSVSICDKISLPVPA